MMNFVREGADMTAVGGSPNNVAVGVWKCGIEEVDVKRKLAAYNGGG